MKMPASLKRQQENIPLSQSLGDLLIFIFISIKSIPYPVPCKHSFRLLFSELYDSLSMDRNGNLPAGFFAALVNPREEKTNA